MLSTWYDMQGNEIEYAPHDSVTGHLPEIFDAASSAPATEQVDVNYPFGGWQKFEGFTLDEANRMALSYPGDPPLFPRAKTHLPLTDEHVFLYPSSWVLIYHADKTWEVARLD